MYTQRTRNEAQHYVFALLHSNLTVHGSKLFIALHYFTRLHYQRYSARKIKISHQVSLKCCTMYINTCVLVKSMIDIQRKNKSQFDFRPEISSHFSYSSEILLICLLGRFRPVYRPRRPLGRSEV
jgi:hypothetical protein